MFATSSLVTLVETKGWKFKIWSIWYGRFLHITQGNDAREKDLCYFQKCEHALLNYLWTFAFEM